MLHKLYRIAFIREKVALGRFIVLRRRFRVQEGSKEGILHAKYSREHLEKFTSYKARISQLMNIVQEVSSDRAKSKVLSVGPRFESELFGLRGLGYKWSNIASLDTYSYSRKIDVGNLHDMPYENNSFDLVLAGFILAYSRKPMTAMKEIARVLRSGGKAIITWELPLDFDYKDTNEIFLYRTFNLNPKYELKRFTIRELLVSDLQLEKLFLTSLHPSSQPTEVILVVNKKG